MIYLVFSEINRYNQPYLIISRIVKYQSFVTNIINLLGTLYLISIKLFLVLISKLVPLTPDPVRTLNIFIRVRVKHSCEVINKLKSRGFHAASLSTYDFSTLYTTLPHNLIKDKLVDLIKRISKEKVLFILHVMIGMPFSPLMQLKIIMFGLVRMCVKLSPFS